jgi:hypothetical protein
MAGSSNVSGLLPTTPFPKLGTLVCFTDPAPYCVRVTVSCVPPLLFHCPPGATGLADCACSDPNLVVPPPTVSCIPPLLWNGTACVPETCPAGQVPVGSTPEGRLICGAPPPATTVCQLAVTYKSDIPASAQISAPPPGCDQAGVELAIAVILAKMLGAP